MGSVIVFSGVIALPLTVQYDIELRSHEYSLIYHVRTHFVLEIHIHIIVLVFKPCNKIIKDLVFVQHYDYVCGKLITP